MAPWRLYNPSRRAFSLHFSRQRMRGILTGPVQRRVDAILERHAEILRSDNSYTMGPELSKLSRVVSLQQKRSEVLGELEVIEELQKDDGADETFLKETSDEQAELNTHLSNLEEKITDAVLPGDEDSTEDAIIEVRAGTGGDEASLFALELVTCYIATAKRLKFKVDLLSESKTALGGVRESSISIASNQVSSGEPGPFGIFQFESGVHRVQRVPVNDTKMQTSACSVAVLPSENEGSSGVPLPSQELRIETMRSSGAGGQHVNTTNSAVRITHIPTGITASIQDERSQHKNRSKAMKLITARVRDAQRREADEARGATRSTLLGGGDRSERIRTFNYPQDRVTDHRAKETRHGIVNLLAGDEESGMVATFLQPLKAMRRAEQLQSLDDEKL